MVSKKSTDVSKSLQSSRWRISWIKKKDVTLVNVMIVIVKNVIVSVTNKRRYKEYLYND